MFGSRFPLGLPLLIALSAGLGALTPSFSSFSEGGPNPPGFEEFIAPKAAPAVETQDPPSLPSQDENGRTSAPV